MYYHNTTLVRVGWWRHDSRLWSVRIQVRTWLYRISCASAGRSVVGDRCGRWRPEGSPRWGRSRLRSAAGLVARPCAPCGRSLESQRTLAFSAPTFSLSTAVSHYQYTMRIPAVLNFCELCVPLFHFPQATTITFCSPTFFVHILCLLISFIISLSNVLIIFI